jgi:hypothetical protein
MISFSFSRLFKEPRGKGRVDLLASSPMIIEYSKRTRLILVLRKLKYASKKFLNNEKIQHQRCELKFG